MASPFSALDAKWLGCIELGASGGMGPQTSLGAGGMIKADIINRVAEDARITKVKAVEAVEAVFEAMKAAMQRGERIELRGFGVFQ
ncbi:MAG: HU family DNA-binding protein, partial [Acidobacteriota bacterium]